MFYMTVGPWDAEKHMFYKTLVPWDVEKLLFYMILGASGCRTTSVLGDFLGLGV